MDLKTFFLLRFIAHIGLDYFFQTDKLANQVSSDNEMPNTGKIIDVLERIHTLTLILVSQYSAVSFLIAAKYVLRYRSDETLKTEYVLIRT